MKFGGWRRLNPEYAKQLGVVTRGWSTKARSLEGGRVHLRGWASPDEGMLTELAALAVKV
jgi:hypothetical protein